MAESKDVVSGRPNGNGRSGQIAEDIRHTRESMDRTVDAILGKLTPQQMLLELAGVMKSGSSTIATRLVETAREHPVPATLIALGIGMLLKEKGEADTSARMREAVGSVRDTAGGVRDAAAEAVHRAERRAASALHVVEDRASSAAHGVAETTAETAHRVADTASGVAHRVAEAAADATARVGSAVRSVGEQVGHGVDRAREGVRSTVADLGSEVRSEAERLKARTHEQVKGARIGFWQTMDQQPLGVGAGAFALGLAAGFSLPALECENRLMGGTRDRVVGDVKELGRDVLHKGEAVARVAAETLKSEARREGLTPSSLTEKVRELEQEARDTVTQLGQETVDKVRRVAQDAAEAAREEAARQNLVPGQTPESGRS